MTIFDVGGVVGPTVTITPTDPATVAQHLNHALAVQRFRVTLTGLVVSVANLDDYGGTAMFTMPDSNFFILGCETDLVMTKGLTTNGIVAATAVNVGIGTAAASNATLSSTMQNILPVTAFTASDAAPAVQVHSLAVTPAPCGFVDGAGSVYINVAAAITADDTVTFDGTIDFYVIDLGNVTS